MYNYVKFPVEVNVEITNLKLKLPVYIIPMYNCRVNVVEW